MLGIIATIIAAKKGHTTFAWVVGIWSAIEIILLLCRSPYAFGPGALFVFIAIGMTNLRKQETNTPYRKDSKPRQEVTTAKDLPNEADKSIESSQTLPPESSQVNTDVSSNSIEEDSDLETAKRSPTEQNTPKIIFCRRCGFKLLEGSGYCSHCGTEVPKEELL